MQLIDTSQTLNFLISWKFNSQQRMSVQHSPAVSVSMNNKFTLITNFLCSRKPYTVDANHGAASFFLFNQIVFSLHFVNFITDIEGIHYFFSCFLFIIPNDFHDRLYSFIKRRVGSRSHQFIIFNKINSGINKGFYQSSGFLNTHPDTWFDNGSNHRPVSYVTG
ncbi:hypothetical protein D3C84_738110 [compost metagenome]